MHVTLEQLKEICPCVTVLMLGQSYRCGGIVICSEKPLEKGVAKYKVVPLTKDGQEVRMDAGQRGWLQIFVAEEGGNLIYSRFTSFKGKGVLVPSDLKEEVTADGIEHGCPEVEGFFSKKPNPLL